MIIRTAHISDSNAIAELSTQLGYPCCEAEIAERLEQLAVLENCAIFVGELDDTVVACDPGRSHPAHRGSALCRDLRSGGR